MGKEQISTFHKIIKRIYCLYAKGEEENIYPVEMVRLYNAICGHENMKDKGIQVLDETICDSNSPVDFMLETLSHHNICVSIKPQS